MKYRLFPISCLHKTYCLLTWQACRFYDISGYAAEQESGKTIRPNDTAKIEPYRSLPSMLFRVTIAHKRRPIRAPHTILLDKMSNLFCTISLCIRFSACSLHSDSSRNILYAFITSVLCTDLQLSLNRQENIKVKRTKYVERHYYIFSSGLFLISRHLLD